MTEDEGTTIARLYGEALTSADAGDLGKARGNLRRTLAFRPSMPELAIALGAVSLRGNDPTAALCHFSRSLALDPLNAHGLYNHALTLDRLGLVRAARGFRRALARAPDLSPAQACLGRAALGSMEPLVAAQHLRRAIAAMPGDPGLHVDLGHALRAAGRHPDAIASYQEAARLAPDEADPLVNLAGGLAQAGRIPEAAANCRKALALAPSSSIAFHNLAEAATGALQEAALIRALAIEPDFSAAHLNLGVLRHAQDRLGEAQRHYRDAVALAPETAKAHHNTGALLMQRGETLRAVPLFRRAVVLEPTNPTLMSDLLFCLCFIEEPDLDAIFLEHRRFAHRFVRGSTDRLAFGNTRDPDRVLRVGYVSSNLHRHPVGHALLGLFEHQDRRRVEITAYAGPAPSDDMARRLRSATDRWIETGGMTDDELAARVRRDEIDILVDCIGHLPQGRLLAFGQRAAPIQIGFPVYPNTTGLSQMDYRIADAEIAPATADRHHSERLIRLPDVYACHHPADDAVAPPTIPPVERSGVFTFASFNNPAKLGDAVLSAWAEILRRAPRARLLLKWRVLDRTSAPLVALQRLGIAPERIVASGWSASAYAPYLDVDCCLDPFVNGGNTTYDALWMGVPVLSLRGSHLFARVGASLLCQVGLNELVVDDVDAYIDTAVALAGNVDRLRRVRQGLRERVAASALADGPRYAAHVDTAYRAVWRRWCDRLSPAALTLDRGGGFSWGPETATAVS